MNTIRVTESFYSIQGEGKSQGNPSVFIRTWGCNIFCAFCDSKSSWEYGKEFTTKYTDKDNFINLILRTVPDGVPSDSVDLVFTGGEPLLYVNDDFVDILDSVKLFFNDIYFETNGTISIDKFKHSLEYIKFNCSPKTSNSEVKEELRFKPEILKQIAKVKDSCFKFVIGNNVDIYEVLDIVRRANIPLNMVYLMPEGVDRRSIEANLLICAKYATKYGLRVSNRMQVQIWNKTMGV